MPIRDEDKYLIMKWRNEQIDVLRQSAPLTREEQENYFSTVVSRLFDEEHPKQFLFSFTQNNVLIGYGGLVHIDWQNQTAEISFLTETARSKQKQTFISDWCNYLILIKKVADIYLNFRWIYTYAYDLRPNLYLALEQSGFSETQRYPAHVNIDGVAKDVVIHTCYLNHLQLLFATANDVDLYYKWANDETVRRFSYQQEKIKYEEHVKWFHSKMLSPDNKFYLFKNNKSEPVGQVRISKSDQEIIIGVSVDSGYRGLGYGVKMLRLACMSFFQNHSTACITAYIKEDNQASIQIFERAGFERCEKLTIHNTISYKYILNNERF